MRHKQAQQADSKVLVVSELVTAVQPISSVPTQYTERHVTYKVWDGQLVEGTEKVRATTTDVTVYDHDGHVTTNAKVYTSEYYA